MLTWKKSWNQSQQRRSRARGAHSRIADDTPAGSVRRGITSGAFAITGDASKVVDRMIEMVDRGEAPLRLTLGASTSDGIRAALTRRIDPLDAQRTIALSVEAAA